MSTTRNNNENRNLLTKIKERVGPGTPFSAGLVMLATTTIFAEGLNFIELAAGIGSGLTLILAAGTWAMIEWIKSQKIQKKDPQTKIEVLPISHFEPVSAETTGIAPIKKKLKNKSGKNRNVR